MKDSSSFASGLLSSLGNPSYWVYASLLDIAIKYRTNRLGVIWIFLSNLLFVLILGNLYHSIIGVPWGIYTIHLYFGLVVWNFCSSSITESSGVVEGRKFLLGATAHVTVFDLVFRIIAKNFVILLHNLIPAIIFALVVSTDQSAVWLIQSILGLMVLVCLVLFISVSALYIGVFLPDTSEILNAVFRIGFLATPIIWMRDKISVIDSTRASFRLYVDLNPFYHMIEIVRAPATGGSFVHAVMACCLLTLVFFIFNVFAHKSFVRKMEKML